MVGLIDEQDSYNLDTALVPAVRLALATADKGRLYALFAPLHAADRADVVEQLDPAQRRELLILMPEMIDGGVLSELDEGVRETIFDFLPNEQVAEAVRDLESDDVVDIIEDLDDIQKEEILDALADVDRLAIERSLSFPEGSAGRLMQREMVYVPQNWTVGQTMDYVRSAANLPDQFYHVVLVDPRMAPVGYVTLGRLLGADRGDDLSPLREDSFRTIPALQDKEDVAYAFNQYHLISAPVVDESNRLVGVITIDDAMVVLDEEHEEDILRLAGVGEGRLTDTALETARRRLPWLSVNLMTAILASLVIAQFEQAISQLVALAVLMPIVASMGGNAGTQSLTVAVRAIATKDLTPSNLWRVVRRECLVGVINGAIFAVLMSFVGVVWFHLPALGLVVAASMIINLIIASFAGTIVPVALERFKIDPALASGTFVTAMTDVIGFFVFLGLASIFLV